MTTTEAPLSFVQRRTIETLDALWPVRDSLGLSRPQAYALGEHVASLPPSFLPRWADVDAWPRLECEGLDNLRLAASEGRGAIVTPAHFGAYHWTLIALLHAGESVSLLVDQRNRDFFSADVTERMLPMYYERGEFHDRGYGVFDTIDSENPTSLWRLSKAVAGGRAAVMFVDGNSGVDGELKPKGSVRINFLGRDVWVRPGIAALGQLTRASVVPVATYFDREQNLARFVFEAPIPCTREAGESRQAAHERVMRALFAWLEAQVRARPDEWEEWWLLPKWWVEPPPAPEPPSRPILRTISLPQLAGRRLSVPLGSLWRLSLPEGPVVFDFAAQTLRTRDPALIELFESAERGEKILTWFREQDELELAKRRLLGALTQGLVAI